VLRVAGIVNGTTNYILSEMASTGVDYASALADASALGYAEADPTADVEGYDGRAKAAILASIAFHTPVTADDVLPRGHHQGQPGRLSRRPRRSLHHQAAIHLRAHHHTRWAATGFGPCVPALVPPGPTRWRRQRRVQRRSWSEAEAGAGRSDVYGPGCAWPRRADRHPRSWVYVVDGGRNRVQGGARPARVEVTPSCRSPRWSDPDRYYVSMTVKDQPGVLSAVAAEFGKREVSIAEVRQKSMADEGRRAGASDPGWGSQLAVPACRGHPPRHPMPRSRRPVTALFGVSTSCRALTACCVWREPANEHYEGPHSLAGLIEPTVTGCTGRRAGLDAG